MFGLAPDVYFGAVLPGALAAAFGVLAFPPFRSGRGPTSRQKILGGAASDSKVERGTGRGGAIVAYLMPLAVSAGFAAAIPGLREVPAFPPTNADGWLFFVAVAALVFSPTWALLKSSGAAFFVSIVWGFAVSYTAVWPLVQSGTFPLIEAVKQMTWSTFGVTAFILFLLRADSASGRGVTLFSELMLSGALMILLIVSASAFLGLLAGTCAAALTALLVLWWFRRDLEITPPAAATLGVLLSSCLLHGYYYAYLPFESAVLYIAAAALLALPIQEVARKSYAIRLAGVGLFLFLSLGLAAAEYFELV